VWIGDVVRSVVADQGHDDRGGNDHHPDGHGIDGLDAEADSHCVVLVVAAVCSQIAVRRIPAATPNSPLGMLEWLRVL
jgi:hypothetical protein